MSAPVECNQPAAVIWTPAAFEDIVTSRILLSLEELSDMAQSLTPAPLPEGEGRFVRN
jgi:hypothetical protein